jgi:hypothetical protein
MLKYGITLVLLVAMGFGFQNCSNTMKPNDNSVLQEGGAQGLLFNTYPLGNISNIRYEHLGGLTASSSTPHPVVTVSLSGTQVDISYAESDGSGQCTAVLGATDYWAYTSALLETTLGVDTSSTVTTDAGDLHLELTMNGSSQSTDFIFQGGDSSHIGNVILNASDLQVIVNSYLNSGCNAANAFQTVNLASITQMSYYNSATPQGSDPARNLTVSFATNSPIATITKTLTNATTNVQISQCSRPLTEAEMGSLFSDLRSATYAVDASSVIISTSGDTHLVVTSNPLLIAGFLGISKTPVTTDYRFQGGDTTHTGSVIFGNDAQLLLEDWLEILECPVSTTQ